MHLSWTWETGHGGLGMMPDLGGCQLALSDLPPSKPLPALGWWR
jgi:hypothetical protein